MSEVNEPSKTILLVFDDPIRGVIFQMILHRGLVVEVVIVEDILEAQSFLADTKTDLLIVDYQVDKNSGIEFIKSIRSNPDFAELPIILYSLSRHQTVIDEAQHAGVNDILLYPLTPKDVLGLVQSLLA